MEDCFTWFSTTDIIQTKTSIDIHSILCISMMFLFLETSISSSQKACLQRQQLVTQLLRNFQTRRSQTIDESTNLGSPTDSDTLKKMLCNMYQHCFMWPQLAHSILNNFNRAHMFGSSDQELTSKWRFKRFSHLQIHQLSNDIHGKVLICTA